MPDEPIAAPLALYQDRVRPEWIDHNDHMNMGYYLVVFDLATDEFLSYAGLTREHRLSHNITTFSLEAHITYDREVAVGAPLRFATHLIDFDEKRIHYIHQMYHGEEGYLASTNELMSLHVSQETRRAAPMAPEITERLGKIKAAHVNLSLPPQAGRHIGLRQRKN